MFWELRSKDEVTIFFQTIYLCDIGDYYYLNGNRQYVHPFDSRLPKEKKSDD